MNSSVLGADCDGYQHRYLDVREATHDRDFFTPNIGTIFNVIHMTLLHTLLCKPVAKHKYIFIYMYTTRAEPEQIGTKKVAKL